MQTFYDRCPQCSRRKPANFNLCYNCFEKAKRINTERKTYLEETKNRVFTKEPRFPSHSEILRDIGTYKEKIIKAIFDKMDWAFEKDGFFGHSKTEYEIKIEESYWDLIMIIHRTPEKYLKHLKNWKHNGGVPLLIEYKSSIQEWGMQVDAFFRQIKNRMNMGRSGIPFLLSFDPAFRDYEEACEMAGIHLVVLEK